MHRHNAERGRVLTLLEEQGGVSAERVQRVAEATGIPEADVWGTGTFYGLLRNPGPVLRVCDGLSCRIAGGHTGGQDVPASIDPGNFAVEAVSCLGQCDRAPVALDPDLNVISGAVGPRDTTPHNPDLPIDLGGPDDTSYAALEKARTLQGGTIADIIEASGLQGRGGAGFPAHVKWRGVMQQTDTMRYVVCNADEGEPGTFKDREVMRRRPHKLLEGLAIAAHAVGAKDIYIYIRGEFRRERSTLEAALADARHPLIDFTFHLHDGHGAYICGEETALLESLEGKRGMPRLKPPFPTERGLHGRPTLIHNVETLACLPDIIARGGERFRALGRGEAGTKLYCISGHVRMPGVYELPLGVCLDELVETAGGYVGVPMAFCPGGASSGFLPMSESARPLDYGSLAAADTMLGSAGIVVLNDTINIRDAVAWQLRFFERESCGQCAPCRIGTRFLRRQVDEHIATGDPHALEHVADIAWEMAEASICGLGMAAPTPLTLAMRHFPEAFNLPPTDAARLPDRPPDLNGGE